VDDEMRDKIRHHREERNPDLWKTIEEETDLQTAIENARDFSVILVDCLTLWVYNLMQKSEKEGRELNELEMARICRETVRACRNQDGTILFVTNEVGMGIVPEETVSRRFRDLVGRCNQTIADEVSLIDVAPTLLSLLDLPPLESTSGLDLTPVIAGRAAGLERRWLFGEWGGPSHTVRAVWNKRFRLLRFGRGERVRVELYDRTADPAETTDLAALRPDIVEPLLALLESRFAGLEEPGAGTLEGPAPSEEVKERLRALGYL